MDAGEEKVKDDTIIAMLVAEFGYTEKRAEEVVQKLQKSDFAIQEAFEKWWLGKGLDEQLVVQGYTLQILVEKKGFNPMNAFLTMDWLIREPARAKRALSRGRDHFLLSPEIRAEYEQRKENFEKQKEQGERKDR